MKTVETSIRGPVRPSCSQSSSIRAIKCFMLLLDNEYNHDIPVYSKSLQFKFEPPEQEVK